MIPDEEQSGTLQVFQRSDQHSKTFSFFKVDDNREPLAEEKGVNPLRSARTDLLEGSHNALIPLTQGQVALVDAEDLPLLAPYHWTAIRSGHTWYAKAHVHRRTIYMHRLIVFGDAENLKFKVDHRNRNGLDNRRKNLRPVTHSRNLMNSIGKPSSRKSGFKGVSVRKHPTTPYRATIHVNRKQRHLGYFASEEEAARAYDVAARKEFGPHACVNFGEDALTTPWDVSLER